jgi:hypothetical protein
MELLKFSPTGQSFTCKCKHCSREQIHILLPGKSVSEITIRLSEITFLISRSQDPLDVEFWKQYIDNTCTVNLASDTAKINEGIKRNIIPEAVRHEVWRRDGGRCVNCAIEKK